MDNYAIYLRKSRIDVEAERAGEGETLARHRKALLDLAHKRGYNIAQIYEEVVSAETNKHTHDNRKKKAAKYRFFLACLFPATLRLKH